MRFGRPGQARGRPGAVGAVGCSTRYRVCLRVIHPPKIFRVQNLGNDGRSLGVHSSTPPRIRPRNQAIQPNLSRGCARLHGRGLAHGCKGLGVMFRSLGVPEPWCSGALVFRSLDVPEPWCSETFDVPTGVLFRRTLAVFKPAPSRSTTSPGPQLLFKAGTCAQRPGAHLSTRGSQGRPPRIADVVTDREFIFTNTF